MVLYTETMAITGTLFTMSAGNINRSRPYVYNTGLDTATRIDKNAQRAFFAGHTAATAAGYFFYGKGLPGFKPRQQGNSICVGVCLSCACIGGLPPLQGWNALSDRQPVRLCSRSGGWHFGAATSQDKTIAKFEFHTLRRCKCKRIVAGVQYQVNNV